MTNAIQPTLTAGPSPLVSYLREERDKGAVQVTVGVLTKRGLSHLIDADVEAGLVKREDSRWGEVVRLT